MRRTGNLPRPQQIVVRLAGSLEANQGEVGLGDELKHRHIEVGTQSDGRPVEHQCLAAHRRRSADPTVQQKPVEHVGEWMDRIEVSGEEGARLGFAHGDQVKGLQATEEWRALGRCQRLSGLAEDVETERVAGMYEGPIALGVCCHKAPRRRTGERDCLTDGSRPAGHTNLLGRHPHPHMALAGDLPVGVAPLG